MEDAVFLCSYPKALKGFEESPKQLNVNIDRVGAAMNALFIEAQDIYRYADRFHSTLMDIGTSGTLEKDRPFRFLVDEEIEACPLESDTVRNAMQTLYRSVQEYEFNMGSTKELLHRILCEMYFEKSTIAHGSSTFSCQLLWRA
eukprot:IDg5643t1